MKKLTKLPREEATDDRDGLPVDGDVEAHGMNEPDSFLPTLPGTGGDRARRPSSGGEATDDDVEGHGMDGPEGYLPSLPGTGGDRIRRPVGGGEA